MQEPSSPLPIRLAQTLGLTSSLLLSGANIALSTYLIPRLLESPTPLLLRQWLHMFESGKRTIPPLAILSTLSYFYLAYDAYYGEEGKGKAGRYLVSGVLAMGIVPYTVGFMGRTNGVLIERAGEVRGLREGDAQGVVESVAGEETAHSLVDWWGVLNLGRGVMLGVSGVLGVWTALN